MPKFLEAKLQAEYGKNSAVPFKVMNAIGAMHGAQETPKGAAMEATHDAHVAGDRHSQHHRHLQQIMNEQSKRTR